MPENPGRDSMKRSSDAAFDMAGIASSAGGLKALNSLLSALPGTIQASIVVVQHIAPKFPWVIARRGERSTPLHVTRARRGDILMSATVSIAPPDQHLRVTEDGSLILSRSEPVHYVRPSADVPFMSLGVVFQDQANGVILISRGLDGPAGAQVTRQKGDIVTARDRDTSVLFGMPDSAIRAGMVDRAPSPGDIAPALCKLVISGV